MQHVDLSTDQPAPSHKLLASRTALRSQTLTTTMNHPGLATSPDAVKSIFASSPSREIFRSLHIIPVISVAQVGA